MQLNIHAVSPNKSLGQHWLHDQPTLATICQSAAIEPGDNVLEIGPGLGTLTRALLERGARVTAVEFDTGLAEKLRETFKTENYDLNIVTADILRFDLTTLPPDYKVVANIPYYITSNLIRVLCESRNPFSCAALLVQKEVAQRVCAQPGALSILGISTQFYAQVSLGPLVPAHLFTPPPKVDSQVLLLQRRTEPLFADINTKLFFRVVKAGFSQRRKTLVNSISGGLALPKDTARDLLQTAGIAPTDRAQALGLTQWYQLYKAYADMI